MKPELQQKELETVIEELKDQLYEHDRAVIDRVGLTGKPSSEEKKKRSTILRNLNKNRRTLYNLTHGSGKPVKINLSFSTEEYKILENKALEEGLNIKKWIKLKVLNKIKN